MFLTGKSCLILSFSYLPFLLDKLAVVPKFEIARRGL